MEKLKLLVISAAKKQSGSIVSLFFLMFTSLLCFFLSVTLYVSGTAAVSGEMKRLGFGDYTVWVNGNETALAAEISAIPDTRKVCVQPLIFSGYEINGSYSDNEGQLIVYDSSTPYRFLSASYETIDNPVIAPGTVYISPALSSSFEVKIGDTINFELTRTNGIKSLTVAGYFEDAFMGSSMIDMKSFLICADDDAEIRALLSVTDENDVLAKNGAMLHITQKTESALSGKDYHLSLDELTELPLYTEFSYSFESIQSYMLLLQNILCGFLLAFSLVLLIVSLVVSGHSLSAVIQSEEKNIAIMKTIGLPAKAIRFSYLVLYGSAALLAFLFAFIAACPLSSLVLRGMITSTGLLAAVILPYHIIIPTGIIAVILIFGFVFLRTAVILKITPIRVLHNNNSGKAVCSPFGKQNLAFALAVRSLLAGKRKYAGVFLVALVLTAFLCIIGRMAAWLGPNGEGLMNAFSVAEHDLGVQPFNSSVPMDEIERVINWYSPIKEKYELAMQSVTVNGQEYTANVLSDTSYFHIISGSVPNGNELLITDTVANEQELQIGTAVQISANGRRESYTVSGIYECANGMGSNIGMSTEGYSKIGDITGYIWCSHYILEDGSVRDYAMKYLQQHYTGIDVHTNAWSGLDGIVSLMKMIIAAIYIISAVIILTAVSLAATKLLASETTNIAVYKSLGIGQTTLRCSFSLRFGFTALFGAVIGAAAAECFADALVGALFRSFGIGSFSAPFSLYSGVIPIFTAAALFFGFAWLVTGTIKKISLIKLISENDE